MKKQKVGLVVDNPHRDLEGLVLVAAHLTKKNFDVVLIPMYKQRFVVKSQSVDIIVLNYLRPNNLETFLDFLRDGIKVAVLDTEGIAGRNFEEFADFVCKTKMTQLIDLYMFWGSGQLDAVQKRKNYLPKKTIITGNPRYDFFAEPWLRSINNQVSQSNFVLFNTNFPIVNPKFSADKEEEYKTMLAVGFTPEIARNAVKQNMAAFLGMKKLLRMLAKALPDQNFILRPHPFEDINGYIEFEEFQNIKVVQSGSANSWILGSSALVHLNCTTAIEASLMGKLVVTPSWLNDSVIYRPLPDGLSKSVDTIEEMIEILRLKPAKRDTTQERSDNINRELMFQSFHHIDGKSAVRVTEAIRGLASFIGSTSTIPKKSTFKKLKKIALNISEIPVLWQLREKLKNTNKSKSFTGNDVNIILKRLNKVEPKFANLVANDICRMQTIKSRFSDIVAVNLSDTEDV